MIFTEQLNIRITFCFHKKIIVFLNTFCDFLIFSRNILATMIYKIIDSKTILIL